MLLRVGDGDEVKLEHGGQALDASVIPRLGMTQSREAKIWCLQEGVPGVRGEPPTCLSPMVTAVSC